MKKQELYNAWKEKKRQVHISRTFANNVMNQIRRYENRKDESSPNFQWFYDLITSNPLAQAALVIIGAIIGLLRFAFVLGMLLGT